MIEIRKAKKEDAELFIKYLKKVGSETDNLTFGAEGITDSVEDEVKYLESVNNSKKSFVCCAIENGEIIGDISVSVDDRPRVCHKGELGISVIKEYWNRRVGTSLMKFAIDEAKKNGLNVISLEVRSDNAVAIKLYKNFGFEKIGVFKKFMKVNGEYVDMDLMNLYL